LEQHRTDDSTNDATNQNKTSTRRAGTVVLVLVHIELDIFTVSS
jgi:hypothetical protein